MLLWMQVVLQQTYTLTRVLLIALQVVVPPEFPLLFSHPVCHQRVVETAGLVG
jgi:hypothetical protein